MKCCLNSNLPKQILKKADQIKFAYKDRNSIIDYIEYEKDIIIDCLKADEIDWNMMLNYKKISRKAFILCLANLDQVKIANEKEILWYWGYPITTFYEAKGFIRLGSCYLKIGAPLFFEWDLIQKVCPKAKIRHTPNVAYNDGLPRPDGVSGTWIRPEDLDLYEQYIDVIEFEDCDREKEQTLYSIYMEQKSWSPILQLLISNLNYTGTNRLISSELTKRRLTCHQVCENGGSCTLCWRNLCVADADRVREYADSQGLLSAT